jgi:WD40 repeat protein/serine/threonine protein kinase
MLTCSLCASTLSEAVFSTGVCPVCGGALHLDDRERTAAADSSINNPVKMEYVEDASITDSTAMIRATLSAIVRQAQRSPVSDLQAKEVDFHIGQTASEGANDINRTSNFELPAEGPTEDITKTSKFDVVPVVPVVPKHTRTTEIGQTIDVRNLSPEEKARVTAMWKGMATPITSPRMTVKAAEQSVADNRKTTLVVKPRDVRKTHEPDSVSADYELLNLIGEGGMGVVYAARQASIDRVVAVKMLNAEIAGDNEQRHKFLSEAVVTGELDHPNIVPIYDLGSNEAGALFYSMKRVVGTPWLDVIQKYPLPQNLEVLMKVADAVAFAHSRGVIHRDLKPENVMLGGFGEVLVMDWGLALSTGNFRKSGSITQSSSMGGTPAYMAPEMATGPVEKVTAASDIYLLGAMLYEVITGQPPHTGKNIMNCLYAAARNEIQPTKHSGELVDVAMRAMSTDQANRYATVQDFQAAVRAYQSHSESIVLSTRAEADLTEAERTQNYQTFARALFGFQEAVALWSGNTKASQRLVDAKLAYAQAAANKEDYDLAASLLEEREPKHAELRKKITAAQRERQARQARLQLFRRVAAGLLLTVFTVVSVAFVVVYNYWNEANVARAKALDAQVELVATNADLEVKTADALRNEELAKVREGEAKQSAIEAQANLDRAMDAEREKALEREEREYQAYVAQIGLSAAKIEENAAGQSLELLRNCLPEISKGKDYRNWEWRRLLHLSRQPHETISLGERVETAALSPDGETLLIGLTSGAARISTKAGETLKSFNHAGALTTAIFVGGPSRVLTAGGRAGEGVIKLWDVSGDEPRMLLEFPKQSDTILAAASMADGSRIVTTSAGGAVKLWQIDGPADQPSANMIREFEGHSGAVWDVDFSPDEKQFVTAGQDRTVILWSLEETANDWPLPAFRGHTGVVYSCEFSPDGTRVVSAGADRRVLVWEIDQIKSIDLDQLAKDQTPPAPPRFMELTGHTADVSNVDFAPDGRQVLSASSDHTVKIWDSAKGKLIKTLRGHNDWVLTGAFTPNSREVVTGSYDGTVGVWPVAEYQEQIVFADDEATPVLSAAPSPDGRYIVTGHLDGSVRLWDRVTGALVTVLDEGHEFLGETAHFLPNGRDIVTGARDSTVRVWNVASGGEEARLTDTGSAAQNVVAALDPTGAFLCTGIASPGDTKSGQSTERPFAQLWTLGANPQSKVLSLDVRSDVALASATFAAREKLLFTGRDDGQGELWDVNDATPLRPLRGHVRRINAAHFTHDDASLLTASDDHTVLEWDPATGERRRGRELFHPRPVTALAVTPDDRLAITACADGRVRVWERDSRTVLGELPHAGESVSSVTISPDGTRAVTVSHADSASLESAYKIHLWDLGTLQEILPGNDAKSWMEDRSRRGNVWQATFSPEGDRLLAVGGRYARLFNLATHQQERSFGPQGAVHHVSFAPGNPELFVTAGADGSAKIWNVNERRVVQKLEGEHTGRLYAAVFAPGDGQVLTAGDDGKLILWDAATGVVAKRFESRGGKFRSAEFTTDGARIITAAANGVATIWDVATGAVVREFSAGEAALNSASLSPDGTRLIAGDADNNAYVWNTAAEEPPMTLTGHTAELTAVGFSPDSSRILTAARDNLVKVWDLQGKELLTLRGHTAEVTTAVFTGDENRLEVLTASRDGAAILWPAAPKDSPVD